MFSLQPTQECDQFTLAMGAGFLIQAAQLSTHGVFGNPRLRGGFVERSSPHE